MLRRLATALVFPLAGLALAVGAAQAQDAIREDGVLRILLLPVSVHSSENPDYLRLGLGDMLAARLEQVDEFEVIRVDDRDGPTPRLAAALEEARSHEADFVLFGSFTRFGQGASVDMMCAATHPTEGREPMRKIFVQSGSLGDVIPDLDELVGKVSRFALVDYEQHLAEAELAAASEPVARPGGLADLRERVEALEAALNRLVPNGDAAPLSQPASPDPAADSAKAGGAPDPAEFARSEASVR